VQKAKAVPLEKFEAADTRLSRRPFSSRFGGELELFAVPEPDQAYHHATS